MVLVHPSGLDLEAVSKLVEEGKLRAIVDRMFPLENVRRAREPKPYKYLSPKLLKP